MVYRKDVTLLTHGYDKYKRTLADVLLPDGMNINQELVKQDWCWLYRRYAPGDTVMEGLKKESREARKGFKSAAGTPMSATESASPTR